MEDRTYKAKDGYIYRRKIDGYIMGQELYLGRFIDGTKDTIDNYEEIIDTNTDDYGDRIKY